MTAYSIPGFMTFSEIIASEFECNEQELFQRSNRQPVATARMFAMWYLMRYRQYSTIQAGAAFNRDHSTAIHASKKIDDYTRFYVDFRQKCNSLVERLSGVPVNNCQQKILAVFI